MDYINLLGKWKNEFSSVMDITKVDSKTGHFEAHYSSTTGATGTYRVTGFTDIKPDPAINSQTIAFAISWRDIHGSPTDANWMSAFSGQVQIIDSEEVMTTTYLLQENTNPGSDWGSTIIDKAIYKRVHGDGKARGIKFDLTFGKQSDNGATPWISTMTIGTPGQAFKIALDSGTMNTWITSARCTSNACMLHQRFNPNLSSTYRILDAQPEDVDFGPWGTMTIVTGADVFTFKQDDGTKAVSERMHFENAIHYTGAQFAQLDWDGGIAIPSPSWQKSGSTESLLLQLKKNKLISHALAAFWMNPEQGIGECTFGYTDPTQFQEDSFQWHELNANLPKGYEYLWSIHLNAFNVNDKAAMKNVEYFIMDSGASVFKGCANVINTLIAAVTDNGKLPTYVTSATDLQKYPNINLIVGKQNFCLEPHQYFMQFNDNYWELGIQVLDGLPDNMLLVGSVFLETVYSVFDYENKRMGLAKRVT